jgi:TPP-dependent indolepyruvate ferredoxin oxidoreductase alpha subunit
MPDIDIDAPGRTMMLMGNEAIARGALEAGVGFIASYPGTPASYCDEMNRVLRS